MFNHEIDYLNNKLKFLIQAICGHEIIKVSKGPLLVLKIGFRQDRYFIVQVNLE